MSNSGLSHHSWHEHSAALVISTADRPARRVELNRARLTIGRDESCDIPLDGTTISRRHAEIFSDPFGRWWVRDLGSRNGIYLGGQRVAEKALRAGDQFRIGDFAVALEQPPPKQPQEAMNSTMLISRDDDVLVSLQEMESPRIAATHLTNVSGFGRDLLDVADDAERRERLCRLLLQPEFGAKFAIIVSAVEGREPQAISGPFFASEAAPEPHLSRRCLEAVRSNGRPTLVSCLVGGPDVLKMSVVVGPAEASSAAACPLSFGAECQILYVGLPSERANAEWLAIISLAAEQFRSAEAAWLARNQAVLHASIEKELEQATHLQRQLIPRDLEIQGIEIAIAFRPCRWVAGDYVGARKLDDGRVLFAVADVCGKGMPAALVASAVHTMLFAAARNGAQLCDLMGSLNLYLCESLGLQRFVTMLCCICDPVSGAIEYANAGHPPGLILRPGDSPRELSHSRNFPLGVSADPCICEHDSLAHGEVLAFYTDGLSELRTASGEMLGLHGVRQLMSDELNSSRSASLQSLAKSLDARLDATRQGVTAQDDMTLLLARRCHPQPL